MIVGIVGKSGSGKNQVSNYLVANKKFCCFDLDQVAHFGLNDLKDILVGAFSPYIINNTGLIDRKKLGEIVFADEKKLKLLESILLSYVEGTLGFQFPNNTIFNGAILHKSLFARYCDEFIYVKANFFVRLFRCLKRDKRSLKNILNRFKRQRGINQHLYLDVKVIKNNGSLKSLYKKLDKLYLEEAFSNKH